jgi:hypothetical protein
MNSGSDSFADILPTKKSITPQTRGIAANTDCMDAIAINAVAGRASRGLADSMTSEGGSTLFVGAAYGLGSISGLHS